MGPVATDWLTLIPIELLLQVKYIMPNNILYTMCNTLQYITIHYWTQEHCSTIKQQLLKHIVTDRQTNQQTKWLRDRQTDFDNYRAAIATNNHQYITLYKISLFYNTILTCNYRLNYISIYRATIAAKPTDITAYITTITVKQLSCIITFYYHTVLLLRLR